MNVNRWSRRPDDDRRATARDASWTVADAHGSGG